MLRAVKRLLFGGFMALAAQAWAYDAAEILPLEESSAHRDLASTTESLPTHARKHPDTPEEIQEKENTIFGDWGGVKSGLSDRGIDLSLTYKGEWMGVASGGLKRGSVFLGNVDILAETDMERLAGIKGMKFVLYGLGNHGGAPSEYVGDSLVTSNIEAPSTFKLYEAYLQQHIDDNTAIIFGLRDLNADFYSTPSSGIFLNSSFGISSSFSQTGVNGPSIFPQAAMAAYVKYESDTRFYFQAGAFNATAGDPNRPYGTHITTDNKNGFLYIWEGGFAEEEGDRPYKYSVGAWNYSEMHPSISAGGSDHVNSGVYFLADQNLTKQFSVFVRHGFAAPQVNTFDRVTEAGVQITGLLPSRGEDALAIGVVRGTASGGYRSDNASADAEMAIEAAYCIHAARGVEITPDFQYLIHPGLVQDSKDTQVYAVRLKLGF